MDDVEDQLRRYGEAVERSASERGADVRDLQVATSASPLRSRRWLAAAAALLLVAGVAAAATIDDDDRIRTADDGAEDPAPEAPPAPGAELDCGIGGLISGGSLDFATDASGRVEGAEPTPEAAFRRFVEEWTLVRYPPAEEIHDGDEPDRQPGYTLEPARGPGRRSITYRLPDLRVVGTFGLAQVNDGEGWVVDGTGSCHDWSGTLPQGTP